MVIFRIFLFLFLVILCRSLLHPSNGIVNVTSRELDGVAEYACFRDMYFLVLKPDFAKILVYGAVQHHFVSVSNVLV